MRFGPFSVPKNFQEVWGLVRNLTSGLTSLSFSDNFSSFTYTTTIAAGSEVTLQNEFADGHIPTEWMVVDAQGNDYSVTRGSSAWTRTNLSLANRGGGSVTLTVRFFR